MATSLKSNKPLGVGGEPIPSEDFKKLLELRREEAKAVDDYIFKIKTELTREGRQVDIPKLDQLYRDFQTARDKFKSQVHGELLKLKTRFENKLDSLVYLYEEDYTIFGSSLVVILSKTLLPPEPEGRIFIFANHFDLELLNRLVDTLQRQVLDYRDKIYQEMVKISV